MAVDDVPVEVVPVELVVGAVVPVEVVPVDVEPVEVVPVAFIGRTSTLMQDPVASLRRQIRKSQAWLPAGFKIVAWYWDVESGGLDLEARSQGDKWQAAAGAGHDPDSVLAALQGLVERGVLTADPPEAELEQIVERLEQGQASLDEALALWERGEKLYAFCRERLDTAQGKVEELARRVEQARPEVDS